VARKALTSKGNQCSECQAIVARDDRFCPQCAAAFSGSYQAVVCDTCGSLAESSRIRCPSCRGELRRVEDDLVEEEDLRLIPSLPLAAQVGLAGEGPATEAEPHRGLRLSLQAAAALCYSAVQAALKEEWIWRMQAPSRARQEEVKKALRTAGDTLHDVRRLLGSPAGFEAVIDDFRRAEIGRMRDREARLMRENEELRKSLATKEVLMLMAEDDLISRLGEDLRMRAAGPEGMIELQAVRRVLDSVGALLSRIPAEVLRDLRGMPEYALYDRLARLYSARSQAEGEADATALLARVAPPSEPFRRQHA
jgi:RNA polymerase subunit RPABC4/transcription elongation factor Spt4